MPTPRHALRRWTKVVLLLSVLAQLAGAGFAGAGHFAAEPVWAVAAAPAAFDAPRGEVPHTESGCWICQALLGVALHEPRQQDRAISPASARGYGDPPGTRSHAAAPAGTARAPPRA